MQKPLGVIGEAQLGAILSQMLAPSQYAEHAPVRPGGEPVADYVVVMPGQSGQNTVYLPIDAGLPMREYRELCVALEAVRVRMLKVRADYWSLPSVCTPGGCPKN
ncbi:MAG: DNA recombination protein RmuC [Christensenellales bacterium]